VYVTHHYFLSDWYFKLNIFYGFKYIIWYNIINHATCNQTHTGVKWFMPICTTNAIRLVDTFYE